ncbi:MAG: endolytic transglycosylase MltG [Anaerolineales bacterium]|nr:endolytic transglycosylase MltG [Anaerolineales bacterium]
MQDNVVRRQRAAWLARLALFLLAVCVLSTAVFMLWVRVGQGNEAARVLANPGPNLNPAEELYLYTTLSGRVHELIAPASATQRQDTRFTVPAGAGAGQIAQALAEQGLLDDPDLFLTYVRYRGLDSQLVAGDFLITAESTIPDLAGRLTQAMILDVTLNFLAGQRIEELADYLNELQPAQISGDEFLALAQRRQAHDLSDHDFLASLPEGATLEGYLLPGTYTVELDTTAVELLDLMLTNFGEQVTPAMRQAYGAQGLSLRDAVTVAAIVQREALLPAERPLIAGVFLNRLAQNMPLQADPTVQYALGYDATRQTWWRSPLFLTDLQVESPYNTYRNNGLPPGPISNPSLGALEAVANPAVTDYLFFVARCGAERDGSHVFNVTFEAHLAYVEACP